MRMQTAICALTLAAAAALAPRASEARVYVNVDIAPPPPRTIVVPDPRPGYVWAPGYWYWNGSHRRHDWHEGYWIRERHGYHWVGAHWEPYGPRWRYVPGYWAR